ncbi:MAG: HD domain-containing protein [Candidatus Omnitrophota bacterium]
MKSKIKKITVYILIELFILIEVALAGTGKIMPDAGNSMLSPALQIPGQIFQNIFLNSDLAKAVNSVRVEIGDKTEKDNKFVWEIEVYFQNDQPGVLNNILHKISPGVEIIWFEMSRRDGVSSIKIAISTEKKELLDTTVKGFKEIKDKKIYVQESRHRSLVLNISLIQAEKSLILITDYLALQDINVSKFLTPTVTRTGYSNFVFELEVPEKTNIRSVEADLSFITKGVDGHMQLSKGQLINKIFQESLLKKINTPLSKKEEHQLLRAIKIVGRRHISESRKDRKTPFIMHQVEAVQILVNEIKILSPEVVSFIAKSLQVNKDEEDEIKAIILLAALLHDAVEDGDISLKKIKKKFGVRVADMVKLLSKEDIHRSKQGEAVYLGNMIEKKDIIGLITQIVKIADRINNLRTLVDNDREFQRKIFFSTLNTFIPVFIDKIDLNGIENKPLREVFKRALQLFERQVYLTGRELGLINKQGKINKEGYRIYEQEEKQRQKKMILEIGNSKKVLAYGVDESKVGLQGLADILIQGYVKARKTKSGYVIFAGPLRPQRVDEQYFDYIAESSGDYGPYYVILDPAIENIRIEHKIGEKKIIMPGFYKARKVGIGTWGLPYKYHGAYLVPTEKDRQFLIKKIEQALKQSRINMDYAKQITQKIITYFEFIQAKEEVCLLKVEQGDTESEMIRKKVLNLSCKIFVEQAI